MIEGEGKMITIERIRHSSALVLSQFIGEGAREYLFTRTYYGFTVGEAKARFRVAVEEEGK